MVTDPRLAREVAYALRDLGSDDRQTFARLALDVCATSPVPDVWEAAAILAQEVDRALFDVQVDVLDGLFADAPFVVKGCQRLVDAIAACTEAQRNAILASMTAMHEGDAFRDVWWNVAQIAALIDPS